VEQHRGSTEMKVSFERDPTLDVIRKRSGPPPPALFLWTDPPLLRDRLEQGLLAEVSHARVNGSRVYRTPNTTNITFPFIEGEALVIALDLKGIACSTGAACSSGAIEPSHVLTAIGLPPEDARASLRFSLGRENADRDVEFALGVIPGVVQRLRELSPVYKRPVGAVPRATEAS